MTCSPYSVSRHCFKCTCFWGVGVKEGAKSAAKEEQSSAELLSKHLVFSGIVKASIFCCRSSLC